MAWRRRWSLPGPVRFESPDMPGLRGSRLRLRRLRRLLLLPSPSTCARGEVLGLQLVLLGLAVAVQLHHVSSPCVVEGGRRACSTVQVLAARAGDHHLLAEEGALGADFLLESVQVVDSIGRRQCVEPPGLLVVLGDAFAELVTKSKSATLGR